MNRQKDKLYGRCPVSGRDELGLDTGYGGLCATRLFGFHSHHKDPPRVDPPTLFTIDSTFFLILYIRFVSRLAGKWNFAHFIRKTGYRVI